MGAESVTLEDVVEEVAPKFDKGVYLLIIKKRNGETAFGEFKLKRQATVAISQATDEHGPNCILALYKGARPVKMQTKQIVSF